MATAVVAGGALVMALISLLYLDSQLPFFVGLAVSCLASMALMLSKATRSPGTSRRDGSV